MLYRRLLVSEMQISMVDLSIVVNTGLSALLAYSGFCRLVHTTDKTKVSVRVSIILLSLAAPMNMFAPGIWGLAPTAPQLGLLAAITLVQVITKSVWVNGPHETLLKTYKKNRSKACLPPERDFH